MERIKDFLLGIIETVSSKISVWAWNKRCNKSNRNNNDKEN